MSELPRFATTSTRRRHHHVDINDDVSETWPDTFPISHSLVNFGRNRLVNPSSGSSLSTSVKQKDEQLHENKYLKPAVVPPRHSSSSSSLSANLSSFITAPASQLWSSAQNSIQALAEQYSQSLETQFGEQPSASFGYGSSSYVDGQDSDFFISHLPIEMPFRDRTVEFRTVVKSCQLKYQPNGHIQNREERDKIVRSSIQFNQLARRIGRDLSLTCAKMEKLTQLAKKKSLFDDRASEVEELSLIIKQDITGLNKQIANLQEVGKQRLDQRDHQGQDHSKLVVVGLQSKLVSVSKNFQNVLEIRTENLKAKKNRREKFSQPACVPSNLPPSASTGNMGSILLHDDALASGSAVSVDMNRLEQHRMQEQMSLIDESESYHRDRYSAMENIESSISELGTIFRQLASLVSEQGEMITRIDSNVEETSMNVDAAHHELLRYFANISKNRWLIIKVFGVLMAFFVFFVIFLT